jgi:hypothetical protein
MTLISAGVMQNVVASLSERVFPPFLPGAYVPRFPVLPLRGGARWAFLLAAFGYLRFRLLALSARHDQPLQNRTHQA